MVAEKQQQRPPGPELETYLETRLNLLTAAVEKMEAALRERIDAVEAAGIAIERNLHSEIGHTKKLLQITQEDYKRAADKAEQVQGAVNVASNEWRGTIQDFKATTASKAEVDRIGGEVSALRLEISTRMSQQVGKETATKEGKDSNMATLMLVASVAGTLGAIVTSILLAVLRVSGHG